MASEKVGKSDVMIFSLDGIVRSATLFNVVCDGLTLLHQVFIPKAPRQQALFASDFSRFFLDSVSAYLNIDAQFQSLLAENQDISDRIEKLVNQDIPEAKKLWARLTANIELYQEGYRRLSYLEMSAGVTDISHYFASNGSRKRTTLVMDLWTRASKLLNLTSRVHSDLRLRSNAFLNKIYIVSMTINRIVKYGLKAYHFGIANRPAIENAISQACKSIGG